MIDNAIYTSIYTHMSLAPEQRFVSKGGVIVRVDEAATGSFDTVTDWIVPDFSD